jgi:alpha-galactosidase
MISTRPVPLLLIGLLSAFPSFAAPLQHKSEKMFRTVNTDMYEIGVRKNGDTDVTLTSGDPVFINAEPMIMFDGDTEPKPFHLSGKLCMRDAVNNRLGKGQGLLLQESDCDWSIQAYPTKPYISTQIAYVNTSKKNVKIKMLIPWASSGFTLGPSTDQSTILENGNSEVSNSEIPAKVTGNSLSVWNSVVYNSFTKRSLIVGFVTNARASARIRIEKAETGDGAFFGKFRAECVYDPPLEIKPGERLDSEILYLGVAEANLFEGLERYGTMFAEINNIKRASSFLPHGWDSWNTQYKTDINEERMLSALNFFDHNLKRYGWTHFAIDAGWESPQGNWEPNPERFPHGMKWMADQIHEKGMTAGIWIDPFTVREDSILAKEHPDWLKAPNEEGKKRMKENERVLDVTIPAAFEYTRETFRKLGEDWGFDALQECDFVYNLMCAESYSNPALTRIDVMHRGMQAAREGFGRNKFITSFTPLPVTGIHCDAMRIGDDCAPIWRKDPNRWPWGCVEAMTNAARRYYFSPRAWVSDPDCAYFGKPETATRWEMNDKPALTTDQATTWFTAAALTGVVKVGDWIPDLSPEQIALLRRLLPTLSRPARPVDLFERETPCIWTTNLRTEIGQWNITAVFNWDESSSRKLPMNFEDLGLDSNAYYTVYDFWQDKFHGLAQGRLNVDTKPGGCHLFGFRKYEGHPMFISTDRHFSQGSTDFKTLKWNEQTRTLEGSFEGVADTDYNLSVFAPEGYAMKSIAVSTGAATTQQDGKIIKFTFHCAGDGTITWEMKF